MRARTVPYHMKYVHNAERWFFSQDTVLAELQGTKLKCHVCNDNTVEEGFSSKHVLAKFVNHLKDCHKGHQETMLTIVKTNYILKRK